MRVAVFLLALSVARSACIDRNLDCSEWATDGECASDNAEMRAW